jgi:hypothetical protein
LDGEQTDGPPAAYRLEEKMRRHCSLLIQHRQTRR